MGIANLLLLQSNIFVANPNNYFSGVLFNVMRHPKGLKDVNAFHGKRR